MRAMFDEIVPRYDLVNGLLSAGFDRWWRRQAASAIDVPRGSVVLDLGCGTGRLGELLAARCRVVGVDVSAHMLAAARRRLRGSVRLVQGSAFRLPFPDGALDGAVSGFVLRNLADIPGAFLANLPPPDEVAALLERHGFAGAAARSLAPGMVTLWTARRAGTSS